MACKPNCQNAHHYQKSDSLRDPRYRQHDHVCNDGNTSLHLCLFCVRDTLDKIGQNLRDKSRRNFMLFLIKRTVCNGRYFRPSFESYSPRSDRSRRPTDEICTYVRGREGAKDKYITTLSSSSLPARIGQTRLTSAQKFSESA